MVLRVVNTIHLEGVDFGPHLLQGLDVEVVSALGRSEEELVDCASEADGIVCSGPVQPWTARVIDALTRCRIIASLSIGYDGIDLGAAARKHIVVTNVPDYCIDEVASHAIALMLTLSRRILTLDRAVRKGMTRFVPSERKSIQDMLHPVLRLQNQVLGIIGLGRIGTAAALKAKGLGMQVVAYDPYVLDAVMSSYGVQAVDMQTLLKSSDIISLHCNLTDETRNMIGDQAFENMKPSCYLINTARGEIVDEDALIRALNSGRIAGAGLDVTRQDPLPADHPLTATPNTILTGHAAWYSTISDSAPVYWHKAMGQVALALQGLWPHYAVNPEIKNKWLEKWGV